MNRIFDKRITCAFLYSITKYGYPPYAGDMIKYIEEMYNIGFRSVEIEGIGYEGIETLVNMKWDIKAFLSEKDIELPVFCTVLPKLTSPDKESAFEAMKSFEKGCEIASFLGAKGVLDNGPLIPYEFPADMPIHRHYSPESIGAVGFSQGFSWNTHHDYMVKIMKRACEIAGNYGLCYYMHPCVGSLTDTTNGYMQLKNDVGADNLRFNFDTSNLYYMRENLALSLMKLGDDIDYIHVSDSFGDRIEHQKTGDGSINWEMLFAALKKIGFHGKLSIDVGGDESHVENIEDAYVATANFLENQMKKYEI